MNMEFEELQQIWDTQNNQPMYVINQDALHRRITVKKEKALHITSVSELLLIIVNVASGGFVLFMNLSMEKANLSFYAMTTWMLGSAAFLLVSRIRRIKSSSFERSMLGDLTHAVSVATYQVRLSQIMRWNILPIGLLSIIGVWEGGKSIWFTVGLIVCFALAYYAGGWEHNIYQSRKRELETLQRKLANN